MVSKQPEKTVVSESVAVSNSSSEADRCQETIPDRLINDSAAERRVMRKVDLHVVPVLAILYTLAFVDRINIGNARIQGLEKDLHMKGSDYNFALLVFFIPYVLFEVPSNLIIKRVRPSTWLCSLMVCWGKPRVFACRNSNG